MATAEAILFLLGAATMIVSTIFRVRIFIRFRDEPAIDALLRGTHAATITDFLSVAMFRALNKLPIESRLTVRLFIISHWIACVLLAVAVISYLIRHWYAPAFVDG